jgi:hypothetical protein
MTDSIADCPPISGIEADISERRNSIEPTRESSAVSGANDTELGRRDTRGVVLGEVDSAAAMISKRRCCAEVGSAVGFRNESETRRRRDGAFAELDEVAVMELA